MVASVKVLLYRSKTLKNGEHPIVLCVTKERNRKYVSLGFNCKPELWDETNSLPKRKHPLYAELVVAINKAKIEASKEVLTLTVEDTDYSLQQLKTVSRNTDVSKRVNVIAYFRQVERRLMDAGRVGYSKVFRYTGNSLQAFSNGKDFDFRDVNTSFLMRYEEWVMSRDAKLSSIHVYMRTFKTLINYARKENVVKSNYNPFKDFTFSKYRRYKPIKRAITKDQMQAIIDFPCKPGGRLYHAKSYFLFSYYNRGINFTDIALLRWSNIQQTRLVYIRKKTNETFNMGLLEPALAIINYYRAHQFQGDDGYIFPILQKDVHQTPRQIDDRIEKVNKRVNRALKEIGVKVGINEKLTTYVARHSFATILKKSGTSIAIISEMMGHDSEKTTRMYLAEFENDVLDQAAQAIL